MTIRINAAGRFACAPDWTWDTALVRRSPDLDLWTVCAGRGTLQASDRVYDLRAGDCFVLRGCERYIGRHDPARPLLVLAVHFDLLDESGRVVSFERAPPLHRRLDHPEFVQALLERLVDAWLENRDANGSAADWLRAALREIQRQDALSQDAAHPSARAIEELCAEIRRRPETAWSVAELAQRLHWSRAHFSRTFRAVKGVTPQAYLVQTRIEAARALLRQSDLPVGRVAELVGYRDIYYFSRHFRSVTGITPSAWRRRAGEAEPKRSF